MASSAMEVASANATMASVRSGSIQANVDLNKGPGISDKIDWGFSGDKGMESSAFKGDISEIGDATMDQMTQSALIPPAQVDLGDTVDLTM